MGRGAQWAGGGREVSDQIRPDYNASEGPGVYKALLSSLTGHMCKLRPREGRMAPQWGEIAIWQQGWPCLEQGTQLPGGVFRLKVHHWLHCNNQEGLPAQEPSQIGVGVEGWRTAVGAPRLLLNPSQQGPCLLSVWSQTAGPGAARRGCFCPHSPKTQHLTHRPMYLLHSLPAEKQTGRGAAVREWGPERGGDVLPKQTEDS